MKRIGKTLITATLAAAMMTGCGFESSSGSITNMTPRETNGDEAENSYTAGEVIDNS